MNKVKNILLLFVIVLLFSQCTGKKKAERQAENAALMEAQKIISEVEAKAYPQSISAKVKLKYKGDGQKISLKAQMEAKRNEYIWMSVKKLGFEGARVLLTPDSVFIINRLERSYVAESYQYMEQRFNLPIAFDGLQAFVWGEPFFLEKSKTTATTEGEKYLLESKKDGVFANYTLQAPDFLFTSMSFSQDLENRSASFKFDKHEVVDGFTLPFYRKIDVKSGEKEDIGIIFDIYKMVLNKDKKVQFEIPNNYKRSDG